MSAVCQTPVYVGVTISIIPFYSVLYLISGFTCGQQAWGQWYIVDNNWFPSVSQTSCLSLRKHAYSNLLKISPPKTENFQIKISDIFHISAQNIDCGYSLEPPRRGGSNEYPQSMFLSRNKKNNVYPCKPQFYYIKVGFKGVKII